MTNHDELTGFHLACLHSGNVKIVQFLIEEGFDFNRPSSGGITGFHFACCAGHIDIVRFLIEQRLDFNQKDSEGNSGFHFACANNTKPRVDVLRFLFLKNFNGINEQNSQGCTPFQALLDRWHYDDDRFNPSCCILLSIENGAEIGENKFDISIVGYIHSRILELTTGTAEIFSVWTRRIASIITSFTMEPSTNASLPNLINALDPYVGKITCPLINGHAPSINSYLSYDFPNFSLPNLMDVLDQRIAKIISSFTNEPFTNENLQNFKCFRQTLAWSQLEIMEIYFRPN
jgi:ankyrin repeat protein